MGYRKLNVSGSEYEYTVGKRFIKIRGFKTGKSVRVAPKEQVGRLVYVAEYCDCCGTPMHEILSNYVYREAIRVTPANVIAYVLKNA